MGKYDNYDRDYFTEKTRYAELISVGVFRGKIRINGEKLRMLDRTYPSLATKSGSVERDGIAVDAENAVVYGLEIETHEDMVMPRRFMTYDACEYERQASQIRAKYEKQKALNGYLEMKSGMKEGDGYYPVINMMLYLGIGHFKRQTTMRDLFKLNEPINPFIAEKLQNYSFIIMEADYVNPEEFKTDLKQFFMVMQCRQDVKRLRKLFEREEFQELPTETQQVIAIHLNNKKVLKKVIEEEMDMCKAMREWERESKKEGIKEGQTLLMQTVIRLRNGESEEELAKQNVDLETIKMARQLICY